MTKKSVSSNDNQLATRAELEASNRELRASLRKCEELLSNCKDKLLHSYGLTQRATNAADSGSAPAAGSE